MNRDAKILFAAGLLCVLLTGLVLVFGGWFYEMNRTSSGPTFTAPAPSASVSIVPGGPHETLPPRHDIHAVKQLQQPAMKSTVGVTYTVRPNDNLSRIAVKFHLKSWRQVYTLNQRAIGANPNLIHPGLVLQIVVAS